MEQPQFQPVSLNDKKTIIVKEYQKREYLPEELNEPPFDTIGLFTYTRTYSREMEDGKRETWLDTIERVVDSANWQLNCNFTLEEQKRLFNYLYNLKFLVGGRFLWQMGTKTVTKNGLMSLQNCCFKTIEKYDDFCFIFDALALGTGVGFSVQNEYIKNIPQVKYVESIYRKDSNDADFIVPDSREGWIKLLGKLLKAHFYSGKSFTFSCHCIRSKGAKISGFGGTASGPDDLVKGILNIHKVLNNRANQQLRSIDVLDIVCIIATIVVAGNVRRSALICLGDDDDEEYLLAKNWGSGNIPNWRAMSNNTIVCNNIKNIINNEAFWKPFTDGSGECYGLFNKTLSQTCGRVGETQYPDLDINGTNPCGEISLDGKFGETCCLSELFLPNINSKEELNDIVSFAYRICKHSLRLHCHQKSTEYIVHKNSRIGVGVTGICQSSQEQLNWLDETYKYLREYDIEYSNKNKFPYSIKLTTCKPSGTLSLLGNCTPGIHPAYSKYYIRRIRTASDSPLVKLAEQNGFKTEFVRNFDGTNDHSTKVIEFPHKVSDEAILAEDMTAVRQLELVKQLQTIWSDNAVSVTVVYKPSEIEEIKMWLLENYDNTLKSVSFLLHYGHNFDQAPMEPITKEVYEELIKNITQIRFIDSDIIFSKKVAEKEDEITHNSTECSGGSCPIR